MRSTTTAPQGRSAGFAANIRSRGARQRSAHRWLLWLAILTAGPGFLEGSATLLAIAALLVGLAVLRRDAERIRQGGLSPITLYALSFAVASLANAVGVQSIAERGFQSPFDLYVAHDYLYFACMAMLVGGVATIAGYYSALSWHSWRAIGNVLPRIRARLSDKDLLYGGTVVGFLSILVGSLVASSRLGTLSALVALLPDLTIFTLSRLGAATKARSVIAIALVLAIAEALHAALFAYLRSEVLLPLFALVVGLVVGSRSLRVLRRRLLIPVYILVALFAVNFATLGRIRATAGAGQSRVEAFREVQGEPSADSADDNGALLVRLSTLNQLSQIGLLVDQSGFLNGVTLEYLGFAFVPRFLWPAKPKIAKGAWFAYRIGLAFPRPDGTYSNSINMTVPGELYLNFGWTGVLVGSYLFGALLALLWSTAAFWSDTTNALGTAFGFYLLWVGVGLGADLQIVVTLVAMYLLFVAASIVLGASRRHSRGAGAPTALQAQS